MKRKLKGAPSAPNYYHHCHVNQPLPFFDSFCLGTGHASKKPQTLTPNTLFLTGIALRNSLRSILHHLPWGYDGLCLWLPLRVHPANSHCFLGRDQSGCDWSAFLGRCQWINYLVFFFLKKMRHQGVFQKKRIIYIYIHSLTFFLFHCGVSKIFVGSISLTLRPPTEPRFVKFHSSTWLYWVHSCPHWNVARKNSISPGKLLA